MLEYTGSDLEEAYYQTFRICYTDVFGNTIFHDLKENADNIFVTQENKQVPTFKLKISYIFCIDSCNFSTSSFI